MIETNEKPELEFFRTTPDGFMSRPPLCSSLQNLESCFFLIALGRFPHALVTCASSVESAMKAVLRMAPEHRITAGPLYAKATELHLALSSFDKADLESFRSKRNSIVHYGFSPRDDEETAILLLKTGLPFLSACYREFFNFSVLDGLAKEFGRHLRIAIEVYEQAKDIPDLHLSYCLSAFGHLIRWSVRQSLMADWENDAAERADEIGAKYDSCKKQKNELELILGTPGFFDCPICGDVDTFVCELDQDRLEDRVIALKRAACASCGFVLPMNCPFLADALCREQMAIKRNKILREFGLTDT